MARTGLKSNGRLKKGYRFAKGGRVVKVTAKARTKARRGGGKKCKYGVNKRTGACLKHKRRKR